jgi:hypothetical protein
MTTHFIVPKIIFVVPYRDRADHLEQFKKHMTIIMEDYPIEVYRFLFIHQCDTRLFNRGAMKNIGFLSVKNIYPRDYKNITLVFNDVDCMPSKKGLLNYETTNHVIKHFYGYTYALGGIVSIKAGDFEAINGFPNFWGWGYEDNMLQNRALKSQIKIDRSTFFVANEFVIENAVKNGQTPPVMNSMPIIQHYHGNVRTMNSEDFDKYSTHTKNGLNSIDNLNVKYDDSNQFINVNSFEVGYQSDPSKLFNYNLQNGNMPMKYISRKGSTATMNMVFK